MMHDWATRVGEAIDWGGELVVTPRERHPPHLRARGMETAQNLVLDNARTRSELGSQGRVTICLTETMLDCSMGIAWMVEAIRMEVKRVAILHPCLA